MIQLKGSVKNATIFEDTVYNKPNIIDIVAYKIRQCD